MSCIRLGLFWCRRICHECYQWQQQPGCLCWVRPSTCWRSVEQSAAYGSERFWGPPGGSACLGVLCRYAARSSRLVSMTGYFTFGVVCDFNVFFLRVTMAHFGLCFLTVSQVLVASESFRSEENQVPSRGWWQRVGVGLAGTYWWYWFFVFHLFLLVGTSLSVYSSWCTPGIDPYHSPLSGMSDSGGRRTFFKDESLVRMR